MNGGLQIVLESFLYWQEPGLAFWVMIYHGMAARDTDSGVRSVSRDPGPGPERGITAEVEQLTSCQLNWVIIGSTGGERAWWWILFRLITSSHTSSCNIASPLTTTFLKCHMVTTWHNISTIMSLIWKTHS